LEQWGELLLLPGANGDSERHIVAQTALVRPQDRPMLGTSQVELEHDAVGVLREGASFSSDKGTDSFAARTMTDLHRMAELHQELTVDWRVACRNVE
jgi:hypothetical protein